MESVAGLDAPLRSAVGNADALEKAFGLRTVRDLLQHLPRRYYEPGELTDFAALREGEHVTVQARVDTLDRHPMRNQPRRFFLRVTLSDLSGRRLVATFFNQRGNRGDLTPGKVAFFDGEVEVFRKQLQLKHPRVIPLDKDDLVTGLLPVYPASKAFDTIKVRKAVQVVLKIVEIDGDDDPLPAEVRRSRGLVDLRDAYQAVHRPASWEEVRRGQDRLRFDEALLLQVSLAQRRHETEQLPATPRPRTDDGLLARFGMQLPFSLTDGQREVGETLTAELAAAHPMHRLLQGEVGSGKTVCALRAALLVVDAGGQAAILAPTEVLATQHGRGIRELLGPLGRAGELDSADLATRVGLLTGSQGAAARRAVLADVASGEAGIVVGTHALLEESVEWKDLGLVVVDEQHRFGVEQRDALRARGADAGATPHVLVMTATPIPRTVAMTVYGDLEVSTLTQLPGGRQPISTFVLPPERPDWFDRAWVRIKEETAAGHQAFVVCPRIAAADEDAQLPGGAAVEDVLPLLTEGELAGLRVAALHGRLPTEQKDATMSAFAAGRLDVLVATTVIEVGIDVPNATVMVVLDADRFGVSQLHQLRGRVGRGSAASWCLLHTTAELGTPARDRVDAVAATLDGAALARVDLEQRREGDVLGASQSGRGRKVRLLDLLEHEAVIRAARQEAVALVAADPTLSRHPALSRAIRAALDETDAAYLEKG
jgi:ATP-dependent DNA helicase RecG